MRKYLHLWFGFLVAAVCLYFAFRGISFRDLWTDLSHAHPLPILIALGFYGVDFFLRTERWAILIAPIRRTRPIELFWVMMIGFFANNILPLRMGELLRAHVCGTKFNISRTASLGTILLERLFDTISFLTTFLVASLFVPFPTYMKTGAWLLGGACFGVIAVLLVVQKHEERLDPILSLLPLPQKWKGKLHNATLHFVHSTAAITRPKFVAESMALSLAIWVLEGTFLFFVSRAFAIHLSYAGSFFLLFALGLSVTLPQAPGFVGTYELFGVTALSLLGIPKSQGLPVILTIHGLQFVFIGIIGLLALWKEDLSFHNLLTLE